MSPHVLSLLLRGCSQATPREACRQAARRAIALHQHVRTQPQIGGSAGVSGRRYACRSVRSANTAAFAQLVHAVQRSNMAARRARDGMGSGWRRCLAR